MANLKAGTLIGGNMIWNHGNMPLSLSNNDLYFKTYKVYTEASKPTPAEVGAVNKAGDTMTGNLTMSSNKIIGASSGYYLHLAGGNATPTLSGSASVIVHGDHDGSGTAEFVSLRAGAGTPNELKILSKTSSAGINNQALTFNGHQVYHAGNKPTYTDVGGAPDGYGLGVTQGARVPNKKLNEAVNAGFYAIYGEDEGGPLNNGLGPSGSRMLVVSWSSVHVTQMFWPINSTDVYVRYKGTNAGDTNWSDWQRIYTTRNPPTATAVGALPISGGTMTGALVINNQVIKGQFDRTLLRDHGNGNVTLSASSNSSGAAGDLYLGYNSGSTNMTKSVRIESPMNWKGGTVIVNDGGINSEFLQGPIRTEKDSANVWHTVVGGTDTINRGRTIIAAGEAGKQVADNTPSADEKVHIAGDSNDGVYIHTGVQNGWGGSTHKQVKFNAGEIYAVDGTKRVFREGWDFGLGGRQGTAAIATDYTEDKAADFNKLITAGEYGISGNWMNGVNNVPDASAHTGTCKVEVRHWSAGNAYIQTYSGISGESINRITRYGTGTYPNITWSKWKRGGQYESHLEYRLTLDRPGDTAYPYMTLNKRTKRTDATGNYVVGTIVSKIGESTSPTDPTGDGTDSVGSIQFEVDKTNNFGTVLIRSRDIAAAGDRTWLKVFQDGLTVRHSGKEMRFNGGALTVDGPASINGKLNNAAFATSNKQILNANSNDYVYVGNPTVKRLYLETDANGEAYVNANGSNKRIYHTGYKPTPADVGAVANSGNQLVNAQVAFRTLNSADTTSLRNLDYAGFFRTNGYEEDGIKLPNLMIHCPHSSGKAHGRGIGFNYAGWGVWTTSWNSSGVFQGMKKIYTEVDKPTAAELGVVNKVGDTMTGQLIISQADAGPKLVIHRTNSQTNVCMAFRDSTNRTVNFGMGTDGHLYYGTEADFTGQGAKIYSTKNKPTASDVGAVAKSGDTMTGELILPRLTANQGVIRSKANNAGGIHIGGGSTYSEIAPILPAGGEPQWGEALRYYGTSDWRIGTGSRIYHQSFKPTASDVGAMPTAGGIATERLLAPFIGSNNTSNTSGNGVSLYSNYNGGAPSYGMMFAGTGTFGTHGAVAGDWATYFTMSGATNRGWIFKSGNAAGGNVASISAAGQLTLSTTNGGIGVHVGGSRTGGGVGLIRGEVQGGSYVSWRDRAAGLLVDCQATENAAHQVWKATHWGKYHVAGLDVHVPGGAIGNAQVVMHVGSTDNTFTWYANGQMHAGDVYIRSDIRLKSNFKSIENAVDKVMKLKGCTYDKKAELNAKEDAPLTREAGIIAQDLQKVLPEAVSETGEDKLLTVSNSAVNALLIEAIKELNKRIEYLESKIKE